MPINNNTANFDQNYQLLLNNILESDLKTIKSLSKPPQAIVALIEAVFTTILGQTPVTWRQSQKLLTNTGKFMDDIYDLDLNAITEEQVLKLEEYVENKDLAPQRLIKIYPNSVPLCNWLRSIYEYKTGKKAPHTERRVTIVESLERPISDMNVVRELCSRRHSQANTGESFTNFRKTE